MAVTVSSKSGSGPKIPEGLHGAICVGVYDLGMQPATGQFADKGPSHKLLLLWEVEAGETISKEYTASISPKSNLRKDLEMWRNKKFSEEELGNFAMSKVLGAGCTLQVQHNNDWARIIAVIPGKATFKAKRKPVEFNIEDSEIPADTPSWIVKKINASITRGGSGEESQETPQSHEKQEESTPF